MKIPRDNLVRAVFPGVEMRDAGDGLRTMTGHFAVFDKWTEINSVFEGRFMERISPGAFLKTFKEGRAGMKVLFQHGKDPQVGDKPIGPIRPLEEDRTGAYYEVGLFRGIPPLVMDGLEAGLYGASFRFSVTREDVNNKAKESAINPNAIPERTIREAQVMEFGPVTFPAYEGATAGVRSMTDAFTLHAFTDNPEALRMLLDYNESVADPHASASIPADIPEEPEAPDASPIQVIRSQFAELRDTTLPAESVDALGSLIEVCESALEAMEDLLGIEDDAEDLAELQADMAADAGEMNSTTPAGDVRQDPVVSEENAPPDGAEAEPHPIRGRRDKSKSYLRKEKPSWQL